MRAAVLLGNRASAVADEPIGPLGPDEALVRVEGCGVCASSLPVWQGRPWFEYPLTAGMPGHEPWGHVAALGERTRGLGLEIGMPVAWLGNRAYADYEVVKAEGLVPIPPTLEGRPLAGEALGRIANVFERSWILPDMNVAVVGAGFIGSGIIQLATAAGARVTAFSMRASSSERALAQGAVAARPLDARDAGRARWPRVIECTGTQAGLDLAGSLVAIGGRLVVAGYHRDGLRTVDMQDWNRKGIDVINAHERDPERNRAGMRSALAAIGQGRLDPWPLLTHRFELPGIDRAFEALERRSDGLVKAYIRL